MLGSASMILPSLHDAVARLQLLMYEGKPELLFRPHKNNPKALWDTEVPYIKLPGEVVAFCGRMYIPITVYLEFLQDTMQVADSDALHWQVSNIGDPDKLTRAHNIDNVICKTYPMENRELHRSMCIRDLAGKGLTPPDIATKLQCTEAYVRTVLTGRTSSGRQIQAKQRTLELGNVPLVNRAVIRSEISKARSRASVATPPIPTKFDVADVLPNKYAMYGNVGRNNGDLVIPERCPVLGIALDWDSTKSLRSVRVWRKHNGAGLVAGNVAIMSTAATWLVENHGYGNKKLGTFMDGATYEAWGEWKKKHGDPLVPSIGGKKDDN